MEEGMLEAFEELKRRCEAAGLKCVEPDFDPEYIDDPEYRLNLCMDISFPRGRNTWLVKVCGDITAQWFLQEPFEKYKMLEGFYASWSPEHQVIECDLVDCTSNSLLFSEDWWTFSHALRVLGLERSLDAEEESADPEERLEIGSDTGLSISIGPASNIHSMLSYLVEIFPLEDIEETIPRSLTLRIEGVQATQHDDAVEVLERVGNSALFQFDLSFGLPLRLERQGDRFSAFRWPAERSVDPLPPVRFEYDKEAMSLYWHGKAASKLPLLQFLAYYQVLEFYFPVYSQIEAQRTLRNVLKDPTFNPMRDADLARLLEAIKIGSKGRSFGNESEQLEATIRHCVTVDDLRTFLISADESRYRFYTSDDAKKLVKERIPVREESADHRSAVASRVYAIRNRIVHSKRGFENQEPLFPFDPRTQYLMHDIELMEFLARRVLIASSRSLQL
jgi:hypothetical protein